MRFINSKTYLMVLSIATICDGSRADPITEEACIETCASNPDPLKSSPLQISASSTPAEDDHYNHFLAEHRDLFIEACKLECKQAEAMETLKDILKAASPDQLQEMRHRRQPIKVPAMGGVRLSIPDKRHRSHREHA